MPTAMEYAIDTIVKLCNDNAKLRHLAMSVSPPSEDGEGVVVINENLVEEEMISASELQRLKDSADLIAEAQEKRIVLGEANYKQKLEERDAEISAIKVKRMDTKLIADLCTRKCVESSMECVERFQKHLKEKKLTKKEREELEEMIVERNQSIDEMIKSDLHKQVSAAAVKHMCGCGAPKPKKKIIIKLSKEENTKRKHRIEDDEPLNLVAERILATKAEAFVDDWYKKGCPLKFDKEAMLKKIMLMRK